MRSDGANQSHIKSRFRLTSIAYRAVLGDHQRHQALCSSPVVHTFADMCQNLSQLITFANGHHKSNLVLKNQFVGTSGQIGEMSLYCDLSYIL